MTHQLRFSLLLVILALVPNTSAGAGPRLVVVVAKGSPITDISEPDLRHVYLSQTTALAGTKVVPFNFEVKTPERITFDRVVLRMTDDEAGRFWIDCKIRGQRPAPRAVPSAAYMTKLVQTYPGALGYLPENELPANIQPVTINGIGYKDPQYLLK
jgi:hypothetical protein